MSDPTPEVRAVLQRVLRRLTPRRQWTQGEYARDTDGAPCDPTSANAACWCVLGAILAETTDQTQKMREAVVGALGTSSTALANMNNTNPPHFTTDALGRPIAVYSPATAHARMLALLRGALKGGE